MTDPMTNLLTQLAANGIPGVIIAVLLAWVFRLMAQVEKVQQARIDDAKAFTERALDLQEGIHRSVDKIDALHKILASRTNRDE